MPIGLASAIGLRQRGIENILVIDQTRAFRQVGQVLDLLPNGLQALKYLDFHAYEEVKKSGTRFLSPNPSSDENTVGITQEAKPLKTSPKWIYQNLQGQIIRSIPIGFDDWLKNYGEGRVSTSWYDLQTTLRQLLPQEQVKPNHRCINVVDEPENGCVRIDCLSDKGIEANPYAYWEDEQQDNIKPNNLDITPQQLVTNSIRAKIIVAADGINSTIRRVLYQDTEYHDFAKPEYSGFAAIGCRKLTEIPPKLQIELEEKFLHNSLIVTIGNHEISNLSEPKMMLFRRPTGDFGYMINLALPLELLQSKSGSDLIDLALPELEKFGFPYAIKELVRISPFANMYQRPYYIHRATISSTRDSSIKIQPTWNAGRVVLVGDAAHGMPPFMAQGANQGLEDALAVVRLIAKIGEDHHWDNREAITTAFEKYECLRRPFIDYVQEATLTRFPQSSDQKWHEYNQKMYRRNFEQVIKALF